jgi:crossover junction endodeoxyribonuclease RusA
MMVELFLPWPDRRLSPNARVHWSSLARAKKSAKNVAFYTVKEAGIGKIAADSIKAKYSFFPPDRHARDADNLISSMKAAQDGIALAIGIDDSKWQTSYEIKSAIEKRGMVKVELEWT